MRKNLLVRLLLIALSINMSLVVFSQEKNDKNAKTDTHQKAKEKGTDPKPTKKEKEGEKKVSETAHPEKYPENELDTKQKVSGSNSTDKDKEALETQFSSLQTDIKNIKSAINDKPVFGIFDWAEILVIALCALLMGFVGIVALYQISSLKHRVKQLEDKLNPTNNYQGTGTSAGSSPNYNPRIDNKIENIEQKINRYDNDIALLQSKIQQLERVPTNVTSSINTTPTHQANTPQQPLLYVSCRGAIESDGITLNVSPNSDNNSIFQINPNNQEVSVMRVEDITLYEVVINSISNFYGILKSDRPPIDGKHKKITTLKAGKVKKLSENQWQIVDKQLIEVKFE